MSPSPNAPSCPRCQTHMVPAARVAPVKPVTGTPVGQPLELAVWLCEHCGVKRPRFG